MHAHDPSLPDDPGASSSSAPLPVLLVTGIDAAARSGYAQSLARDLDGLAVAVHEPAEAELGGEETLNPLADPVEALTRAGLRLPLVVDVSAGMPVAHAMGLVFDLADDCCLHGVLALVDADTLEMDLAHHEHAHALADCLECATHHVLLADHGPARDVALAMQPEAHVLRPHDDGAHRTLLESPALEDGIAHAGWLRVINDEWPEHVGTLSVSRHRYERHRPFHRARLDLLLRRWRDRADKQTAGVRISGLCRLGDAPEWTLRWDQIGARVELTALAADAPEDEEVLSLGQDLAVFTWGETGLRDRIVRELDAALVTDEEFAAGPDAWR